MAKMNKTISFKNCEFHVTRDELTGEKRIMILEQLKDDDIWTDVNDILEMFADETGLTISIKVEKGIDE